MSTETIATRRHFFWKAGAALTAPLAAGAAHGAAPDSALAARLALIEELDAIRSLQRELAARINGNGRAKLGELFTDSRKPGALASVRELRSADFGEHDTIEFSADSLSAEAVFRVDVVTESPLPGEGTIVEMARAQGDGFVYRPERRRLAVSYLKQGGRWRIHRLQFGDAAEVSSPGCV